MLECARSSLPMSFHRLSNLLVAVLAAGSLALPACGPASISSNTTTVKAGTAKTREAPPRIMSEAAALAAQPAMQSALRSSFGSGPSTSPRILPAPIVFSSPNKVQREVFGFVNAGNLGNASVGYPSWNLSLLSTVAFFALQVNSGDGNLVTNTTGWYVYHSSTMSSFVAAAHASGTRVIVSLNLHGTSQVCTGLMASNAQNTINQIVPQVYSAGIDGVNVNYEAENVLCANGQTSRSMMTAFMKNLRAALPTGYIAIDTYSGSAEDNLEFFDITGLAPYVDSFFVMAYDMDIANYSEAPLSCTSYCFNPVSPLSTYRFNVMKSMQQYTALVPRSKVVLGQPYYGRDGCVWSPAGPAHQYLIAGRPLNTPTYFYASTVNGTPGYHDYVTHRDPSDGVSEWDTFGEYGVCTHEQYWDDVVSLSAKYDLVNAYDLRGVGLFTLDYAGGASEVWSILATHFSQIPGAPGYVNACAGNASATVSWTAAPTSGGPITSYVVKADPGGATVTVPSTARMATVTGLTPGTAYTLTVNAINASGQGVGGTASSVTPIATAPIATSYFMWFDRATQGMVGDNIHLLNPGATAAAGCVALQDRAVVPINLAPGQETYLSFPNGTIGGPVTVTVNTGPAVLASQRVQYFSSFNEVPAMNASQSATTSYLSWFDRATPGMFADNIHVLNPSTTVANVTVSLGGATPIVFTLQAGQETYVTFPHGTIGGPVTVNADHPVLASQRVQYYQSFNEVVARSAAQAITTSYFNWFDKATAGMVGDNIHILNTGANTASVTVSLSGVAPIVFPLQAGQATYVTFLPGHIGGPVTVTSSQPVLASQRVQYYQSFNETPSESAAQARTTSYVMWFDRVTPGMYGDNIHILNTSASTANLTISLAGASPIVFTLPAGAETYVTYLPGHYGGPVTITSDQPVLAAQRVQYYQSFNEVAASGN
jgi:spore germination protein YaaH